MDCKLCEKGTLLTEIVDNCIVLVCSSCGGVTYPNGPENESTNNDLDGDDSRFDYFSDTDEEADGDSSNGRSSNTFSHLETTVIRTLTPETSSAESVSLANACSEIERFDSSTEIHQTATSLPVCKACQGNDLILDTINETEQWVCQNCGYFVEEQEFVSSNDYTAIAGNIGSSTNCNYQWTRAPKPRFANDTPYVAQGKTSGIQMVKDVSAKLSLRQDMTDEAVILFESLYNDHTLKRVSVELKETVGVCCVYAIAREHGVKVTLKTLMRFHKVKMKLYSKALNMMKAIRETAIPYQKVASLPQLVLGGSTFESGLVEKVTKLIDICERGFVTQGRNQEPIVLCAAYLVWLSHNMGQRKSVTFPKFCLQHNLPFKRVKSVRLLAKMKTLLTILVNQLPYLLEKVPQANVLHYLDDVIKYSKTVISRASSADSTNHDATASSESHSQLPALAPPCMMVRKKEVEVDECVLPEHIHSADLDREDIEETEFSDHEIDSYLLSPGEVIVKGELLESNM